MQITQLSPPLEWRDVVGFEGYYKVSNHGNVKRVARKITRPRQGDYLVEEAISKPHVTPKGYHRIQLVKETKHRNKLVHRLVAEAFLPNPKDLPIVNHISGVKTDNRLSNLEWISHSGNIKHAYDIGLRLPNAKYLIVCPDLDLVAVGCLQMQAKLIELGHSQASDSAIWNCINGHSTTHLGLTFKGYLLTDTNVNVA